MSEVYMSTNNYDEIYENLGEKFDKDFKKIHNSKYFDRMFTKKYLSDCVTVKKAYEKFDKKAADGTLTLELKYKNRRGFIMALMHKHPISYLTSISVEWWFAMKKAVKKYENNN